MAYCSLADLKQSTGWSFVADLSANVGSTYSEQDIADRRIGNADGKIHRYLGGRYEVSSAAPFDPVPDSIRDASIILTVANYARASQIRGDEYDMAIDGEKEVLHWLELVGRGELDLYGAAVPVRTRMTTNVADLHKSFTADKTDTGGTLDYVFDDYGGDDA